MQKKTQPPSFVSVEHRGIGVPVSVCPPQTRSWSSFSLLLIHIHAHTHTLSLLSHLLQNRVKGIQEATFEKQTPVLHVGAQQERMVSG